jgi:hypothetical protein
MTKVCNGWDDTKNFDDDGSLEAKESLDKSYLAEEKKNRWQPKKIWAFIHRNLFDMQGGVKAGMREKIGGKEAENLIRSLELSKGGSAVGNVEYEIAFEEIYEDLTRKEQKMLDYIIQSRRIVSIEKNLKAVARSYLDDRAVGTVFDTTNPKHVAKLKEVFGEDKLKKLKKKKFVTIRKLTSKADSDVAMEYHNSKKEAEEHAKKDMEKVLKDAEILHPDGVTGEKYQAYLDHLKKIDADSYNTLDALADKYFSVMNRQLGFLRQAGLITQQKFENLKKVGDYSPRRYLHFIDPDIQNDPLKGLTTGSTQELMMNSSLLMKDYITKLHTRIGKNNANVELHNFAKENPNNGIAEIVDLDADIANNFKSITAFVDGEKVRIKMPLEYGKEWGEMDPAMDGNTAKIFRWLSGSAIVRAGATGYNPEFALANLPRDIFFSWFRTKEYSTNVFLPIAPTQIIQRLAGTAKDIWNWKDVPVGKANEYLQDGGMMEFMTAQGLMLEKQRTRKGVLYKPLRLLEKVLAYTGQKTELWVRLALRDQAIKNRVDKVTWKKYEAWSAAGGKGVSPISKDISKEATWIARGYLDFSQGGKMAKAADVAIPYLNAGLQATRGMFNTLSGGNAKGADRAKNSLEAVWKMSQFIGLYGAFYISNLLHYPDDMERVDDTDKAKNLIFFSPILDPAHSDKDVPVRGYFKIALDQGQSAVANLVGLMVSTIMRENYEFPVDSVWYRFAHQDPAIFREGAKQLIPLSSILPPTINALINANNLDTFRGEQIYKGRPQADKGQEYTPFTHPALIMSAKKLNELLPNYGGAIPEKPFSPERMKFVLNNFFIQSNSLVRLGAMGADYIADEFIDSDLKKELKGRMSEDLRFKVKRYPGADRIFEFTHSESVEERKKAQQLTMKETSRIADTENKVKSMIVTIYKLKKGDSKGQKMAIEEAVRIIRESDLRKAEKTRLIESVQTARAIKYHTDQGQLDTVNPLQRWWQEVAKNANPYSKALAVFTRWRDNPKERDQILREFKAIKRISNPKTVNELTGMINVYNRKEVAK